MSPERLHRAAIAVYAVSALREAAIPLLAIFVVGGLGGGFDSGALLRGLAFAIAGALFSLVAGYLRWRTTTWWVGEDGAVHHRSGIIARKATDVPVSRIQAIDVEQGPVQRRFGVQALHVQTGGGGAKGEIVLDAVGPGVVQRLRDLLAAAAPAAPERPQDTGPVRTLARRRLLLAAVTAGQFGVVLPVLAVLGQLGESLFSPERGRQAFDVVRDSASSWALIVAALLLLAWLLSVLGTIMAFSGFTVTRQQDRLRIRRGLLARREATVPVERVRAVVVVEGLLRRPLRLASLRLEVIGHAAEPSAAQTLFPLLPRDEVRAFLDELLPELADELDGLAQPPDRARLRYVLPPAAITLAVGAALWPLAGPWPLALALAGAGYGAARFGSAGWRLADGRLAVRTLRIARSTVLAPAANRESHAVAQTLLQRRRRLATLHVAFGKSTDARIAHLDAAVAQGAFEALR